MAPPSEEEELIVKAPIVITRSECATCGTPMVRRWTDDLADFHWWAEDGSTVGTTKPVLDGAPKSWPELLEHLEANGSAESYSLALTRYQAFPLQPLPWEHRHEAIVPPSIEQEIPECHGRPMRAAPGAWICRLDGESIRPEVAS